MIASVSEHMSRDNADRFVFIEETVGLGQVIYSTLSTNRYGECKIEITSTGVLIVKTMQDKIITLYIGTYAQISWYFPNHKMPFILESIVIKNMKMRLHILQNGAKK